DEIVIAASEGPDGHIGAPVFLAEVKQPGFDEFLKKSGLPLVMESRNGVAVFGPDRTTVDRFAPALDNASGGFKGTPFYARIAQVYQQGAGLLLCADLSRMHENHGVQYIIAEQKEVNRQMEARASIGGIGDWLAAPAPMASLDYVSPEATLLASFVAKNPGAAIDSLAKLLKSTPADFGSEGEAIRNDIASSLGGEITVALDGPAFPVPSWKIVAEVYDPARLHAGLQKAVAAYNAKAVSDGNKPL